MTKAVESAPLFRKGLTQAEVARRLNVSRETTRRWYNAWQEGGTKALKPKKKGRASRLSEADIRKIERAIAKEGKTMSLSRAVNLVWELTGVEMWPNHVWRLLRSRGWTTERGNWKKL